jgi:hypothetical protein
VNGGAIVYARVILKSRDGGAIVYARDNIESLGRFVRGRTRGGVEWRWKKGQVYCGVHTKAIQKHSSNVCDAVRRVRSYSDGYFECVKKRRRNSAMACKG